MIYSGREASLAHAARLLLASLPPAAFSKPCSRVALSKFMRLAPDWRGLLMDMSCFHFRRGSLVLYTELLRNTLFIAIVVECRHFLMNFAVLVIRCMIHVLYTDWKINQILLFKSCHIICVVLFWTLSLSNIHRLQIEHFGVKRPRF